MARPTTSPRRYAEAIFELARRDGTEDAWQIALEAAASAVATDEALRIVENPAIPLQQRLRAVMAALSAEAISSTVDGLLSGRLGLRATADVVRGAIAGPVRGQLVNLVGLLVERRRVSQLPAIASEYARLIDRERGIVPALVTSAAPLTDAETSAVQARVEVMTGTPVSLRAQVDPELIGGLTVRVGDRLLDASVRGRLERLRDELLAGSRQAHG